MELWLALTFILLLDFFAKLGGKDTMTAAFYRWRHNRWVSAGFMGAWLVLGYHLFVQGR